MQAYHIKFSHCFPTHQSVKLIISTYHHSLSGFSVNLMTGKYKKARWYVIHIMQIRCRENARRARDIQLR